MHTERPLEQCTRWFDMLQSHFPKLSRAQVRTLALWSFAATITQHIASTTCAFFLAQLFGPSQESFRERLRGFYREGEQKPGTLRQTLCPQTCFAPLLAWILSLYRARDLVLALDVTLCRDRLAVISLSVVFRGSALPVAWKMLPANEQGAWVPHCTELIKALAPAVPDEMPVFVLCDRGLQSRTVFKAVTDQRWHPMIRLVRLGCWREQGDSTWYRLSALLGEPGRYYIGEGELFKTDPLACTLIALWEADYEAPWLLMTDLAPDQCQGSFYGLRSWIEQGFRVMKSCGYQCERLRVVDAQRAERIWLVMAVSLLWTHSIGGQQAALEEASAMSVLFGKGVRRVLGVHRSGWIMLLVAAIRGQALPLPELLVAAARPVEPKLIAVLLKHPP